jgi:uncharacterized membrane protein YkoI
VKQGNIRKASIEKRENQPVWDVRIDNGGKTAAVWIDMHTGNVLKTIDDVSAK